MAVGEPSGGLSPAAGKGQLLLLAQRSSCFFLLDYASSDECYMHDSPPSSYVSLTHFHSFMTPLSQLHSVLSRRWGAGSDTSFPFCLQDKAHGKIWLERMGEDAG